MISPVNTSHAMFIWKVNQIYEILLSLNVIALSNSYMYMLGHSKFDKACNLFFFLLQNCFYIKLLIITFIRICDVQY